MAIIVDNDTRLVVQGLTGSEGRKAIADFRVNGEQLFFPTPR